MGGERVPESFTEQTTRVGAIRINYVRGGRGSTLVLLHGYPQTWYMWRKVLPELARHYTVIAPDLRGSGGSDAPDGGYDKKTLANDVYGLLSQLGLERDVSLVGHDIGAMVAYAYAAARRDQVSKLVLAEAPIPDDSLYQAPSLTSKGPGAWNYGFFNLRNGLPEQLVNGREALWVERFTESMRVQASGIGDDDVNEYARYLQDGAHLRASFEYFRAMPQDVIDNAEYAKTKLSMPVLAVGARGSLEEAVLSQVTRYATTVTGGVVENCGHWIFEEQPAELTARLLQFLQPAKYCNGLGQG